MTTMPMPAALIAAARAEPHAPALTVDDATMTRAELVALAVGYARAFERLGVTAGDFATVLLPNSHDFIAATIGAQMLAATPQPLSNRLAPAELEAILELTGPAAAVIADDDLRGFGGLEIPVLRPAEVERAELGAEVPTEYAEATSAAWKAPTSGGSTGRPKVIVSAAPATVDPDDEGLRRLTRLPTDRAIVVPGPLYHNGPFLFAMFGLLRRNHVVLSTRFDPRRTLEQIARHRAIYLYAVPTMMMRISRLGDEALGAVDLSSLETVMHTASACPHWLKEDWMDRFGDEAVYEIYGGTEQIANTVISGAEWRRHRGSVGRPVAGELRIVGDDGTEMAPGEVGELFMRRDPDATPTYRYLGAESKRIEGGWESLGDVGRLDQEGYLYLADKRSDLILRGGANIYPAEVEVAIEAHPAVLEAVVVGLPDEDLGQRVHGIVRSQAPLEHEELSTFLAERLSRYKIPTSFDFVTEPLRDDSGKVRRSMLREERSLPPIAAGLFVETAAGPRLVGSRCRSCGTVTFPRQASCARCAAADPEEYLLSPRGNLWTWTVQRFRPKSPPYTGPEEFEPYGVGYVELPGECRVEAILTTADPDELRIGMAMELRLIPATGPDDAEARTFAFAPAD
ncbi:MAG: AMP-binding protein [Actinobacteria bacterium]|nr:AMP-binding protein [Actinomycetota bacterium]